MLLNGLLMYYFEIVFPFFVRESEITLLSISIPGIPSDTKDTN